MSTRFINSTTQLCQSFWHVAHDERPKRENNGAIAYQSTELGSFSVVKTGTQTSSEQLGLAQSRVHQSSSLSIRSTHGKTSQDAARTHHRLLRHDSRRHTSLPANATVARCRHDGRDALNTFGQVVVRIRQQIWLKAGTMIHGSQLQADSTAYAASERPERT